MKRGLLLFVIICISSISFGQDLSKAFYKQNNLPKQEHFNANEVANSSVLPSNTIQVPQTNALPMTTQNVSDVVLGYSDNVYTMLVEHQSCLSVNEDLGLIQFTHRAKIGNNSATNSGDIITTYSTNDGNTWSHILSYPNGTTANNRYPSGVIFNPANNTVVNNAFTVYVGPAHDGVNWNYAFTGSRKFNNTAASNSYQSSFGALLRNGMVATSDNKVRIMGASTVAATGNHDTTYLLTGAYDSISSNFSWTKQTFTPSFITNSSGNEFAYTSHFNTAWSSDGTIGYYWTLGRDISNDTRSYQPIVWKSTNSGSTWVKMPVFNFAMLPAITNHLQPMVGVTPTASRPQFSDKIDGVVDANGNLHLIALVKAAFSNHNDSLGFSYIIANVNNLSNPIFDVHTSGSTWVARYLGEILTTNVDYTEGSYGTVGWDLRLQAGKTADGTKIFASWTDSDTSFAITGANGFKINSFPNLIVAAWNITNGNQTQATNFTASLGSSNANLSGDFFFHYMSDIIIDSSGTYKIPITEIDRGFLPTDNVTHNYVKGISFVDSDFINQGFPVIPDIVISEINYNGPESGTDTTEFIELYNNTNLSINLGGFSFAQGVSYTFPSVNIAPHTYLVVAYDSVVINNLFGITAYEWTSGGLSNGGEDIILVNNNGDTVDVVDYDDASPWPTSPDGSGPSLSFCDFTLDNSIAINWIAATDFAAVNGVGDTIWANPGTACGVTPTPLSDTIPPVVNTAAINNSISIIITFSEAVGISAENTANYTGLGTISSALRNTNGNEVTLTLATALVNGALNVLTIDNVQDTSNNVMANAQSFNLIFNTLNPDIVITEIMYNDLSQNDSLEYFEIYNNGTSTADIGGFIVTEGVEFIFPAATIINAGGYLVIAKDAALVNSVFGISGTLQWTSGGLKNSGEDIEIQNSVGDTIDYVNYSDGSPWPIKADGDGPSIELCDESSDNNLASNWSISEKFISTFNVDSIFGTPGEGCFIDAINNSIKDNDIINIYPNPANNKIQINSNGNTYDIKIFDISGSIVERIKISGTSNTIYIEHLKSGMYFIRFINVRTKNTSIQKLIIQ